MTRDDIIRMAREAGSIDSEDVIETVYAAFAAAERERLAQPQWQGLTDREIEEIARYQDEHGSGPWHLAFARAIEAKLKEKNA